MAKVNPIPDGHHTITPYLTLTDANAALAWYQKALGAELLYRMDMPDGRLGHAEVKVGTSMLMLSEQSPMSGPCPKGLGGSPVCLHLYVEKCDDVYNQAVKHGATGEMPPQDMFWGDRFGMFTDPFGHKWSVATHIADPTPEEMQEAMKAMASCGDCGHSHE